MRYWREHAVARSSLVLLISFSVYRTVSAGITVDQTLSAGGSLAGPSYQITANLGRLLGPNLFFSFSQFNLMQGETATFSGPASVSHVISRVTGGQASSVDGALASTIAGADFYFINPAGVMFGPHATIDITGSLYVSTAHYLTLVDGGRFDAANPSASSLTSAPPQAFGFLGGRGAISFSGSQIAVQPGATLAVVGGDITLDGAQLSAPGGRVYLASADSADELQLGKAGVASTNPLTGAISLSNGALVSADSSGNLPSGTITVDSGSLTLNGAAIGSQNNSSSPGGDILINASQAVSIDSGGTSGGNAQNIFNFTGGAGAGGNIVVTTPALTLTDSGSILTQAFSSGNGGNINLNISGTLSVNAGLVQTMSFSSGKGGDQNITAGEVTLSNYGTLDAEAEGSAGGGSINVTANDVQVLSGGAFNTATDTFSNPSVSGPIGNAGNITIVASSSLAVIGDSSSQLGNTSVIGSFSFTNGNAGSIQITTPQVKLDAHGSICACTVGYGYGNGGDVTINAQHVSISNGGGILAGIFPQDPAATGNAAAGNITITASQSLTLSGDANNESQIDILNQGLGSGAGGTIKLTTPLLSIDANSYLNADIDGSTQSPSSIEINAGTINLAGVISGSTHASGNGPDVSIVADHSLTLASTAEIFTDAEGSGESGNAGRLTISTPLLIAEPGAVITSATAGSGNGGSISIEGADFELYGTVTAQSNGSGQAGNIALNFSDAVELHPGALISTQTSSANGGDIHIESGRLLYLDQAEITASAGSEDIGSGNGGNIMIDPQSVVLNDSSIQANAFGGRGGNVSIVTVDFIPSSHSLVQASSRFGVNGTIDVSSPVVNIGQNLGRLSTDYLDASRFIRHACPSRGGHGSSFIAGGRGRLPESEDAPLFSPLAALLPPSTAITEDNANRHDDVEDDTRFSLTPPSGISAATNADIVCLASN